MNLTGVTVSSQSHELETISVADRDATTTPPPVGGKSKTGAQEYNIILPDKGKGKTVSDNVEVKKVKLLLY